jgi:hypothetical protein
MTSGHSGHAEISVRSQVKPGAAEGELKSMYSQYEWASGVANGVGARRQDPGGVQDISRWLSEAIPPDTTRSP